MSCVDPYADALLKGKLNKIARTKQTNSKKRVKRLKK